MNHISLFSGIGGFDLAAEWIGWNNIAHCEMNEFCLRILKYYWPHAATHTDIRTTDFTIYHGRCDILTGGFPCQPYSTAGKRLGKADERHLWPHMLRAIQEISPRWVVGENVRGLTNWNGGMVFDEVQSDLEAAGYEVTPFILPAASVNAPHRRDRIWFIAYSGRGIIRGGQDQQGHNEYNGQDGDGGEKASEFERLHAKGFTPNPSSVGQRGNDQHRQNRCQAKENEGQAQRQEWDELQRERVREDAGGVGSKGVVADAPIIPERKQADETNSFTNKRGAWAKPGGGSKHHRTDWQHFPTQPPVCSRNDGVPAGLVPVAVSGRGGRRVLTDRQAYAKIKKESLKAAGNAIVPQVAYNIFQAIQQYENS